ncbi:MAG: O-antigen ligase family protein [Chloroflexota bacterium]
MSSLFDTHSGSSRVERSVLAPWQIGLLAGVSAVAGGLLLAFGGVLAGLAVLLAAGAGFLVLRHMEAGFWGLIAVICLLPFGTIPIDLGLTPTLLDVALAAVVGVWVVRLATGRQRTIITAPITVPLVALIIIAVFSFIFGLGHAPLTPTLLRHFAELLLSLAFVLVVIDYVRTWTQLERLVTFILYAGAGAAVLGIGLWLLPDDTANTLLNYLQNIGYPGGWVVRYIEENPELAERAIATSVDPNSYGGLLVLIGALAGPQLVSRKPVLSRTKAALVVLLVFVALFLTFSRGAMVGLVAALAFVGVVRYRRLIPYLLFVGLLMLVLPITQGYVARFLEGLQGQDLATQMRFGEYRDALTLIARYPLFGVGFAASPDIDIYLGVASVYLSIAQQMGVLGLTAFIVVIATLFGYAFVHRHFFKKHARYDSLWLGLHGAVAGGMVVGVFDHYLFNLQFHNTVTIFWLFVGLAVAATRLGSETDASVRDQEGSEATRAG